MRQYLFLITLLCILSSCSKEKNRETVPGNSTITIKLQVWESVVTKSQPFVNEEIIKNLNLFAYDARGRLIDFLYLEDPGTEINMETGNSGIHSIYAIANKGNLTDRSLIVTTDGLKSISWELESPDDIVGSDGEIPMSGFVSDIDEENTSVIIPLTRMLAKFRIIVDTTGLDEDVSVFDITEVRIRNMNRTVCAFKPSGAASTSQVFSTGASANGKELEKIFTSGIDFYISENYHGDLIAETEEQKHIPPVPYDQYCTFIEFHVKYRSSEHYNDDLVYRYYLHDGVNYRNFDIIRNYMYTCRTIVKGSGLEENSWRVDLSGLKDFVTSIEVTPEEVDFYELNETCGLTASVLPVSAENPDITWISDDEGVATVSQDGIVKAVGDGVCTIMASAVDGSGVEGSCTVHVYADSKMFEIRDFPDTIYPYYNSPYYIRYNVYPYNLKPTFRIECLSGEERGAMVSDRMIYVSNPGKLQKEIGRYRLTGEAGGIIRSVDFSVSGGELVLNKLFSNLYVGIPSRLSFNKLEPADVKLNWSTSDPSMLEIDDDGNITPLKVGRCTVSVESATGISDRMTVNILEPYLTFSNVTMYEGATWTLVSSLRPVSADLPVEYLIIKGEEYVSIEGNKMYGLKRTMNQDDVIIQVRLVDYPHIRANARVTVIPAVTASLTGDNKVVNTYGLTSDGSSWNFKNYLSLDIEHAPNVSMTWEVRDEDGQLSSEIQISENGTINPYSSTANGKYFITGWDHLHRFSTDRIEIEVYRLLEYECGLGAYGSTTVNGRNVYVVTLIARWSNPTWNIILNNGYTSAMLQNSLITYPHVSTAYHSIGSPTSAKPYIQNFTTNIAYFSTQNVINALSSLKPLSYLRDDFSTHAGNSSGINGKYYKFTTAQNGFDGYFFIKQRNESFYNSSDYR